MSWYIVSMRVRQYNLLSITATQTKSYSVHNTSNLQRIYNSDNSKCREQAVKTECTHRRKGKEEVLCMDTGLTYFYFIFCVRLLSVLRGHSVSSSPPQRPMTSDFEGFSIPDFIHHIYCPVLIFMSKSQYFPFWMLSAKQGNHWYHFGTSLVWRGPWLGIEPGTSRSRSQ